MSRIKVNVDGELTLDQARSMFNEELIEFEVKKVGETVLVKSLTYNESDRDKLIKQSAVLDESMQGVGMGEVTRVGDESLTMSVDNTWYLVGDNDYVYISDNSVEKSINRYFNHLQFISSRSDLGLPEGVRKRFARATSRYNLPVDIVNGFGLREDSLAHAAYIIDDNKMTIVPEYFVRMGVVRVGGKLIDEFSKTVVHEFGHAIWHQALSKDEQLRYIALAPKFREANDDADNLIQGYTNTLNGKRVYGEFWTNQDDKFVSIYARMSVKEDFAESFLYYVLCPDYLLGFDKTRYDFINAINIARTIDNVQKSTLILPEKQQSVQISDLLAIDLQTSELRRRLALEFEGSLKRVLDGSKIGLEAVKNVVPFGSYVKLGDDFPEDIKAAVYAEGVSDGESVDGNVKIMMLDEQEKIDNIIYESRVIEQETKPNDEIDKEIEDLERDLEKFDVKVTDDGAWINKRFYAKDEIDHWITTSGGRRIPIPKEGVRGTKAPKKTKTTKEQKEILQAKKTGNLPPKPPKSKKLPLGHIERVPKIRHLRMNRPVQTVYSMQRHFSQTAPEHIDLRLKLGNKAYSWAVPEWPVSGQKGLAVLQPSHSVEYMKFQGAIKTGYGAGRVKLEDYRGIDITDWNNTKKAFNIYSGPNKGRYALVHIGEKNYLLIRKKNGAIRTPLKVEYTPARARLKLKEEMWKDPNYVIQAKMNGARSMMYIGKDVNRILSRAISEKQPGHVDQTDIAPHLRDLKFDHDDLVLDGEIFTKDRYTTSAILNSSPIRARELQKKHGLLKLYVFDILRYNGNDLRELPYKIRLQFLERAIGSKYPYVKVIPSFKKNKKAYYNRLVKMGYEGIVLKNLEGKYGDRFMTKKKPVHESDYVVMGSTPGKGKYKGLFGALILGTYKNGELTRVGKMGSGFTEKERIAINEQLPKLIKSKAVIAIKHLGLSPRGVPEGPVYDRVRTSKTWHDIQAESLGNKIQEEQFG